MEEKEKKLLHLYTITKIGDLNAASPEAHPDKLKESTGLDW